MYSALLLATLSAHPMVPAHGGSYGWGWYGDYYGCGNSAYLGYGCLGVATCCPIGSPYLGVTRYGYVPTPPAAKPAAADERVRPMPPVPVPDPDKGKKKPVKPEDDDAVPDPDKVKKKPAKPENDDDKEAAISTPTQMIVELPADARLFIDGQPTRAASHRRVYTVADATPGQTCTYTLRAEVVRAGKTFSDTRYVVFQAGRTVQVYFAESAMVEEAETSADAGR